MAPNIPLIKLNESTQIPVLGFGTGTAWYKADRFSAFNPEMVAMLKKAIAAGYRHIDTAEVYGTEAELGQAIKESGVPREEFFIVTKLMNTLTEGTLEDVSVAMDASLKRLQMDYVDLYLLHSPYLRQNTFTEEDVAIVWKQIEALQRSGKTKSIGISNFRKSHVEALLKTAEIKPALNSIQFHPYLQGAPEYATWLKDQGIAPGSYMGLAPLTQLPGKHLASKLEELAAKYGASESTILIRWQLNLGLVVLNTTKKEERMQEYFKGLTLELSEEDTAAITSIGQSSHARVPIPVLFDGGDITVLIYEAATNFHRGVTPSFKLIRY